MKEIMESPEEKTVTQIPREFAGQRADVFLSSFLADLSRSSIKKHIERGNILIDRRTFKPSKIISGGESLSVNIPPPEPCGIEGEEIDIGVVYEDRDIIVVNKPAGMVVHPGAGITGGTLVNALLRMCGDLSGIRGEMRPGIVHRLDKETSGVMVVAKNDRAHESLSEQFKARETKKEYVAVVSGEMKKNSGVFSSRIGRSPSNRVKMTSFSKIGRDAETRWEVVERLRGATLVSVWPKTGRTHQIRVHFSENGFPVLADKVYGGKKSRPRNSGTAGTLIGRHALHAKSLGFTHPATGKRLEFSAEIPEDMVSAIGFLRGWNG